MTDPIRLARWAQFRRLLRLPTTRILAGYLTIIALGLWWVIAGHSGSAPSPAASVSTRAADPALAPLVIQSTFSQPNSASVARKLIYPYSVIPGGIGGPEELQRVSQHDRVVSDHYAGFDFRHARIVQLEREQLVYLSYRLKNKIYWTHKKIALRKGEKVITDGKITARTRCANQISPSAKNETSPEEPPAAKFDEPLLADGSSMQFPPPGNFQSSQLGRQASSLGPGAPPGTFGSGSYGPGGGGIFPPPFPGGGGGTPHPPPPPPPPPPPVPEPGTLILMSSGAAAIYLRYRKRNK